MCGRYTQSHSGEAIAAAFELAAVPTVTVSYNIAPTQLVSVVLAAESGRQHSLMRWGLVPGWAKDPSIGNRLINARAETVHEKPSFRTAFRRRRCLVIADGFYEWHRLKDSKTKQPYYFQRRDRQLFAFAGLWEHWQNEQEAISSCTLLTTQPNSLLAPVHDRMPVMLPAEVYDRWLNPQEQRPESLQPLLVPYTATEMQRYPVSQQVNNPSHNSLSCIEPIELESQL
ncbi:MAG: SOS response-associated peptidase [Leptolyngbyaceae cyanobacterium SM1_1_3]|nr:SOS response-associated peptidase [Leptolyngbyaceae cyanobacterium SM1_1_3]NJN03252.1 SOS response-associated peptidase [Leptolyngbyaceae cyanobacterium RM1_1_2]NJO11214.1 SOS response-associated peptidase [Leptolyngbyaceae cyanobacterium SL_1_1]